jgi:membrane associated rhomboid family serine protease
MAEEPKTGGIEEDLKKPALSAEGLEIFDESTPWRRPALLPEKPAGFIYGVRFRKHPKYGNTNQPCETECEMRKALEEFGPNIDVVYLPGYSKGVPKLSLSCYVPFDRRQILQMFLKILSSRGLVAIGGIAGAIYLNTSYSILLFLIGLSYGVVPVFDALLRWWSFPKNQSFADLKRSMVDGSVFFDWLEGKQAARWLIWLILALLCGVFYGQTRLGNDEMFQALTSLGAVDGAAIRNQGEWWRLFTGPMMHAAAWHIFMNGIGFYFLGKYIHRLTFPAMVTIVFVISALVGALASAFFGRMSVGASGGVVGMIGFLSWLSYVRRSELPYEFRSATFRNIALLVIIGILGFFFFNIIDNAGHGGGFVGGVICGITYDKTQPRGWVNPATWVKSVLGAVCLIVVFFSFACCLDLFFGEGKYLISHLPKLSW